MEAYDIEHTYATTEYDEYDEDYPDDEIDYLIYDDGFVEQVPQWNRWRVIAFIIALVIIVAMVVVLIAPLLQTMIAPVPAYIPPPATPPSQL